MSEANIDINSIIINALVNNKALFIPEKVENLLS